MNIGVIIPSNLQKKEYTKPRGLMDKITGYGRFFLISVVESIKSGYSGRFKLVICSVPFDNPEKSASAAAGKTEVQNQIGL